MTKITVYSQIPQEFKDEDLVCYCFGYTRAEIEKDYRDMGFSTIFRKISAEKKVGKCDCTQKNLKAGDVWLMSAGCWTNCTRKLTKNFFNPFQKKRQRSFIQSDVEILGPGPGQSPMGFALVFF